ncbi:MAG: tetratricopeptide repeat protein [Planctomycetota bacterium]|nr:MAG: tetratricopeptide repeat protein [Planctomycetota bacterium]
MRRRLFIALIGTIVVAIVLVVVTLQRHRPPRFPNILLISIDTCRADYLGCYGQRWNLTPNIDRFAHRATRFAEATSPVPMTLPAHCSMLTGLIPPAHGVHDNLFAHLPDSVTTLAERLKPLGYTTAAFVGAFVLDPRFGLAQGFDTYDAKFDESLTFMAGYPERRAKDVTDAALAWLQQHADERFFLFVHYYDPHHPYRAPSPFDLKFAEHPYAAEVAYTDSEIGRLLKHIEASGLFDDALILITADHGEGLGQHGEAVHGIFVYRSTTHVPLLIKMPRQTSERVIDSAKVGLIDIVPTVLSVLKLEVPPDLSGKSLLPYLQGKPPPPRERYIYSESLSGTKYGLNALFALEGLRWKFIQTTRPELYDLRADPDETHDLAEQMPRNVRELRAELRARLDATVTVHETGKTSTDEETLRRLRQLGYTGGPVRIAFTFDTTRPDPKDYVKILPEIESIDFLAQKGETEKVRRHCEALLEKGIELPFVYASLGRAAMKEGDNETAWEAYHKAIDKEPDRADWLNDAGVLAVRMGRPEEARTLFRRALAADPNHEKARKNLARLEERFGG